MNILKVLTERRIKGNIAEKSACRYLRRRGYRILERNYVAEGHEIDIIAENKEHICFVEVKSRTLGTANPYDMLPRDSVNKAKQKSIISAAKTYSAICYGRKKFRFDVAEVYLSAKRKPQKINYLESAFDLNTLR